MGDKHRITLNILTLVAFVMTAVVLGLGNYTINIANSTKDELNKSVEMQNRQYARNFLLYLNDRLTQDVENKKVNVNDDNDLIKWASDNLRTTKSDSTYASFSMIKVRFDNEKNDLVGDYLWSSSASLSSPIDSTIRESRGRSTLDIIIDQKRAKDYFSSQNSKLSKSNILTYKELRDNELYGQKTIKELLDKKIVRFKNPEQVQKALDEMYQGTITKNNDTYTWLSNLNDKSRYLIEWTTVPSESSIGLNNEQKTIKGFINPEYKRLVIVTAMDSAYIKKSFEDQFTELNSVIQYVRIFTILFVLFVIGILVYCTWLLYHPAKKKK
ncbi:hypothetical protein Bp8pS_152 [Bacillus phage vB_BpuM-BpSp]|nr:hypothetical protein Bp8pS_152 [Bacillus phage vB_BpuM-BpSp]